MCENNMIYYGLKLYSFICTLHYLITIIIQSWLKVLNTKNASQIYSIKCVSKIKLMILIIILCNIWGCVFLGYQFLWWGLWEYAYLIILSSSNPKYE